MKKILIQYGVCTLAVALVVPLAQAQGQPAGMQAAFGKDAGTLSDKFTGLARVMSGKYDWKPGHGVRSVGDVFNLIVRDRKSTRLNSSHLVISYAVFCLKKKKDIAEALTLHSSRDCL